MAFRKMWTLFNSIVFWVLHRADVRLDLEALELNDEPQFPVAHAFGCVAARNVATRFDDMVSTDSLAISSSHVTHMVWFWRPRPRGLNIGYDNCTLFADRFDDRLRGLLFWPETCRESSRG